MPRDAIFHLSGGNLTPLARGQGMFAVLPLAKEQIQALFKKEAPELGAKERERHLEAIAVELGQKDADSLPQEDSLQARALSARAIAVAWWTYDGAGRRIDHRPDSPLDAMFYLRRPKGKALHLFHGFRTRDDAVKAMADRTGHDPQAREWAPFAAGPPRAP